MTGPQGVLLGYAALSTAASLVTFVLYGLDKRAATRGAPRIAERTLHLWSLCGGWIGAWGGQRTFRHKTQKRPFRLVFWSIGVLHVGVLGALFWWWLRT
ncbi:MAG: DUF1294 domain-containing protein [Planctomycetes bacterium]|nr:DUF1294 domain-containing protein [Planctomycetota bacterium]MCB9870915.1 DUF1294 domain-containing protein [Planctomycetota bacterium]